jgi:hypothetical protein
MSPVIPRNFVTIAETSAKIFSFGAIGLMNYVIRATREGLIVSFEAQTFSHSVIAAKRALNSSRLERSA